MANKELTGRVAGCAARVGGEPSGQGRSAKPAAEGATAKRESPSSAPPRREGDRTALSLFSQPRPAPRHSSFFSANSSRGHEQPPASPPPSPPPPPPRLALTSCASLYYLFQLFLSTMLFYAHLYTLALSRSFRGMYVYRRCPILDSVLFFSFFEQIRMKEQGFGNPLVSTFQ